MTRTNRKGFTLIEILIVVIILGILAAIVIPQFTNASKEAKQSSLVTQVQSMRSQIALFKLQHNDYLPGQLALVGSGGTFSPTEFWNQLTMFTDVTGATNATKTLQFDKGPYMQSIPKNPLCPVALNASVVEETTAPVVNNVPANAAAVVGFIYDYQGGAGSGKIWGTDTDGKTPVQQ
jgi:general secretion pathway protein G